MILIIYIAYVCFTRIHVTIYAIKSKVQEYHGFNLYKKFRLYVGSSHVCKHYLGYLYMYYHVVEALLHVRWLGGLLMNTSSVWKYSMLKTWRIRIFMIMRIILLFCFCLYRFFGGSCHPPFYLKKMKTTMYFPGNYCNNSK